MNVRALKLKANSEEYDAKIEDIKRLKNAIEVYLKRNFYFERVSPRLTSQRLLRESPDVVNLLATTTKDGVSIDVWQGGCRLEKEAQYTLDIVRLVHDNMDAMIELAEELCKQIGRYDAFKAFLGRFDVE